MRVLLLGAGGQLGHALVREFTPEVELIALDRAGCDLARAADIRAAIGDYAPDAIVNAAAYTAVDRAETDVAAADAVNAIAPGVIGAAAVPLGATVVHYSTDYVFDGAKATPYTEDDPTAPLSVYGRSKRDGELSLAASGARALTLRVSWVVGAEGANFARTMLRLARERDRLTVVADQHGVPTPAPLIAALTSTLLRRLERDGAATFPFGLYHLAPSGETTWFEYARFVLAEAERRGVALRVRADAIEPIRAADYPTAARRPANSRLDTSRFRATFGLPLPSWTDAVRPVLQEILDTP
jgi:dTDP-4-dehydrorhamnose reductase